MLRNNQTTIGTDHENKTGREANESMFSGPFRETRRHKLFILPEYSGNGYVEIEQAWSRNAEAGDALRMFVYGPDRKVIKKLVFQRKDFEQVLFLFAQGDEVLKYGPSMVKS